MHFFLVAEHSHEIDTSVSYARGEDEMDDEEKIELMPPEDVGEQMAYALLGEIEQGGVVDSTHQVCLCLAHFILSSTLSELTSG